MLRVIVYFLLQPDIFKFQYLFQIDSFHLERSALRCCTMIMIHFIAIYQVNFITTFFADFFYPFCFNYLLWIPKITYSYERTKQGARIISQTTLDSLSTAQYTKKVPFLWLLTENANMRKWERKMQLCRANQRSRCKFLDFWIHSFTNVLISEFILSPSHTINSYIFKDYKTINTEAKNFTFCIATLKILRWETKSFSKMEATSIH